MKDEEVLQCIKLIVECMRDIYACMPEDVGGAGMFIEDVDNAHFHIHKNLQRLDAFIKKDDQDSSSPSTP